MSKFKVGDRIKIIRELEGYKRNILNMKGTIHSIYYAPTYIETQLEDLKVSSIAVFMDNGNTYKLSTKQCRKLVKKKTMSIQEYGDKLSEEFRKQKIEGIKQLKGFEIYEIGDKAPINLQKRLEEQTEDKIKHLEKQLSQHHNRINDLENLTSHIEKNISTVIDQLNNLCMLSGRNHAGHDERISELEISSSEIGKGVERIEKVLSEGEITKIAIRDLFSPTPLMRNHEDRIKAIEEKFEYLNHSIDNKDNK